MLGNVMDMASHGSRQSQTLSLHPSVSAQSIMQLIYFSTV